MTVINDDLKRNVGRRLRELRESKGLKIRNVVDELSKSYYCNMDEKSIRRYEKGEFLPKIDNLICFAEFFGTTLDYIIYGKELSDDNSFTWYDQFKRLNRLIYSLAVGFSQSSEDGKIYLELWDEETKVYWERLQSSGRDRKYAFEVRGTDPQFTVKDMDALFLDFMDYKEQLLPTKERMEHMIRSHGGDPEEILRGKLHDMDDKRKKKGH